MEAVSDLFSIETNINFSWTKISADSDEFAQLKKLTFSFFGISASEIQKIKKRNLASQVYLIQSDQGGYVLRETDVKDSEFLEHQAEIVNQLDFERIIRPLKTNQGQYTAHAGRKVYILYPYQQGDMFSGNENIQKIMGHCLDLLTELRQINPTGLPVVDPALKAGLQEKIAVLLNAEEDKSSVLRKFLSEGTLNQLKRNRAQIESWAKSTALLHIPGKLHVTHNDLNHANLITTGDSVFVLDIEDICAGNPDIALSHCIFKLFRHAIYTQTRTLASIQNDLDGVLSACGKAGFDIDSRKKLFDYGAVRIFSDIDLILTRIEKKAVPAPTDLEKKIHNLFELAILTDKEKPWTSN